MRCWTLDFRWSVAVGGGGGFGQQKEPRERVSAHTEHRREERGRDQVCHNVCRADRTRYPVSTLFSVLQKERMNVEIRSIYVFYE